MRRRTSEGRPEIGDLVNSIPALSRGELLARWQEHYGTLPHKLTSTRLLVMAVAYAVQAEQHGGLPKHTPKELLRIAESAGIPHAQRTSATKILKRGRDARPRSGTRFVREWNGRSHVVEVVENGFAWQGQTYRSLSAIASLITGTRWSGPRFFGIAS